jgi:hypothetical protein
MRGDGHELSILIRLGDGGGLRRTGNVTFFWAGGGGGL